MEHLRTYYSLEKHLEETVKYNPQFEILYAIWKLNKESLAAALSNISQYYPHYSLHEKSHSNTIISNIESFLGEERIKRLSPTDTWLILMASFTHDLGMVVFYQLIEKEWASSEFQIFLNEIREWDDDDLKSAGDLICKLQELSKDKTLSEVEWLANMSPLKIKNSVTLVVAEYIRRIHHKRSSDILTGIDKAFFEVAHSFYSDQIPSRLLNILGEVAYLHGVNFYQILKRLDYQANGISNDKIHPRFIAVMLRLGDLLDIDDKRFNSFTERIFQHPDTSKLHKQKHSSIKHFLISPEAIEITSDCEEENVYRLARTWFDLLEEEVENQSREWSNIAPKDLGGASPQIPSGKIKVYYNNNGKSLDDSLLNLRFQVSNKKIFEILEGAAIYEKVEFTFIRELVQNAIDASKIQLWKEIEKGTFDYVFRDHFKTPSISHDEIIERIKFPGDIPNSLMNSFQINLSIRWEDDERKKLIIIVEDNGTGISNEDVLRMTKRVGESRKMNNEYLEMMKRIPFWLRPTGAFGIGLQSVFLVTDTFKVQTKTEGEDSKEVMFRSAKRGKYSSFTSASPKIPRGTRVIISIPEENFPDVFGTRFNWEIVMNYDFFSDEYGSIYIPKIRMYIEEILGDVKHLSVNFFGKEIAIRNKANEQPILIDESFSENSKIYCKLYFSLNFKNLVCFEFYESIIGSQFWLQFPPNVHRDLEGNWPDYQTQFYVRDIPVKDDLITYYKLPYSKLDWNFMSPESDKILNLTREKLLEKPKQIIASKFLLEVIPIAIQMVENIIIKNKNSLIEYFKDNQERLSLIYFKVILTKAMNQVQGKGLDLDLLGQTTFPEEMVSYLDRSKVQLAELLNITQAIVPILNNSLGTRSAFQMQARELIDETFGEEKIKTGYVVIWFSEFFREYLEITFQIKKISFTEKGQILFLERRMHSTESVEVEGEKYYLEGFLKNKSTRNRCWNYASAKYSESIAVLNVRETGFERFPYLSRSSIISPFKNIEEYNLLITEIKSVLPTLEKEKVMAYLTDSIIKKYVTKTLSDWILSNAPSDSKRNFKKVIEGYRELISDMICLI